MSTTAIKPTNLNAPPPAPTCAHKWAHLDTAKWRSENGRYNWQYIRVDTFFCEKCLEYNRKRFSESAASAPDWFQ